MEIGELALPRGEKKNKWVPVSGPQHIDSGNPFVRKREGFYCHLKKQTLKQCGPSLEPARPSYCPSTQKNQK